jgi:hypothetical protein
MDALPGTPQIQDIIPSTEPEAAEPMLAVCRSSSSA